MSLFLQGVFILAKRSIFAYSIAHCGNQLAVLGETLSYGLLWTWCAASMCPKLILNISKGKTKVEAAPHIT